MITIVVQVTSSSVDVPPVPTNSPHDAGVGSFFPLNRDSTMQTEGIEEPVFALVQGHADGKPLMGRQ